MSGETWAFEDFSEGDSFELGPKYVSAQEIIEFASEFDPQPMHLDEAAGRASILGGLSASGWHTCAIYMRLMADAFILDSTSQGAPGVDRIRWKRPVLAGDTLTGTTTVLSKRVSQSRPTIGFVAMRTELLNQHRDVVLELENSIMFLKREAVR
jgi:acyl dehydratase